MAKQIISLKKNRSFMSQEFISRMTNIFIMAQEVISLVKNRSAKKI
jgi:hypothetical protein